jgi:hypothetical protein
VCGGGVQFECVCLFFTPPFFPTKTKEEEEKLKEKNPHKTSSPDRKATLPL